MSRGGLGKWAWGWVPTRCPGSPAGGALAAWPSCWGGGSWVPEAGSQEAVLTRLSVTPVLCTACHSLWLGDPFKGSEGGGGSSKGSWQSWVKTQSVVS